MALIGTLALFVDSAVSVFEAWLGLSSVLSGYLIPLDLFPEVVRAVALKLPFRFLLSFPVELMLGRPTHGDALLLLAGQWAYVALAMIAVHFFWRAGMRRFGAFGG
jgi:ABC-2 type transport system permease protein